MMISSRVLHKSFLIALSTFIVSHFTNRAARLILINKLNHVITIFKLFNIFHLYWDSDPNSLSFSIKTLPYLEQYFYTTSGTSSLATLHLVHYVTATLVFFVFLKTFATKRLSHMMFPMLILFPLAVFPIKRPYNQRGLLY